jgi:hypothetical protein
MADLFKMVENWSNLSKSRTYFLTKANVKIIDSRSDILVRKTKNYHAWQKIQYGRKIQNESKNQFSV